MARLRRPPGLLHQWWTLSSRFALTKWKSVISLFILLAQAPVIGFTLVWVYHDTTDDAVSNMVHIPLFLLVTVAIWFGCSNSAREIVSEQVIFHRERMLGQSIVAYILSKAVILLALSIFQCVVLLGMVHIYIGLHGSFPLMLAVMILCAMGGVGMGFLLSAVVPTPEAANAFVPLVLIPQLVFGGLMQPLGKMDPLPALVAYSTPTRWGYEALMLLEEVRRNEPCAERDSAVPPVCDVMAMPEGLCGPLETKLKDLQKVCNVDELEKLANPDTMLRTEEEAQEPAQDRAPVEAETGESQKVPSKQCMPTRFTRACEFVVEKKLEKEYEAGPYAWLYSNVLGADRRSTEPGARIPDVPMAILFLFAVAFHVAIFFVLKRRDVGVEKR
jgi:hypothetical protein